MRTLTIAGLAMVTAITATPAVAQRAGAQGWQGRGMAPAAGMPGPNAAPGVTWNRPGTPINATPLIRSNPQIFPSGQRNWSNRPNAGGMQNRPHMGGNHNVRPLPGYRPIQPGARQSRWGGSVGGRWYGGSNAPGGWKAYRHPVRGWSLPRYWIAPSFFISDYGLYGLSTPPGGYNWTRYYDDAVLTDSYGRVYDSVSGIDWDSDGDGYGDSYGMDGDYGYDDRGGPGYGDSYAPPPPPPVQYTQAPPPPMVQGGYTQTWSSGGYAGSGGYASGGYWYPPATTTTVTIQSAPVVTTTTTEYVETSYRSARRVYKAPKRVWRPKTKVRCACN